MIEAKPVTDCTPIAGSSAPVNVPHPPVPDGPSSTPRPL
jgi:hypothetical protein